MAGQGRFNAVLPDPIGHHSFDDCPRLVAACSVLRHEIVGVHPAEAGGFGLKRACLPAVLHVPEKIHEVP